MTPIDIQVSRSKVKVKGHANLLHLVQLITPECFAPKASNLVSRWSLMSRWPLLIFRSVGQRSVSKVKSLFFICWGRGALVFYKQLYFHFEFFAPFSFLTNRRSPCKWNKAWPFTCSVCCFSPQIWLIIKGICVNIAAIELYWRPSSSQTKTVPKHVAFGILKFIYGKNYSHVHVAYALI